MHWQLKWTQETENYIFDNAPYTILLCNAVVELAGNDQGMPKGGAHNFGDGFYMATIVDHTVVYELQKKKVILVIRAIRPTPTEW